VSAADRFAGRTAIVTGGASALGKTLAARIVAEGGQVLLWDVDAAALHAARDEVGQVSVRAIDVSDQMAVASATAEARNTLGGQIDILINAARIPGAAAPLDNYPIDNWLRVIDVNLNGTFYCCRAVAPYMAARGYGRIVNVASTAGQDGAPDAASGAGVTGFTQMLASALAPRGIIASAVNRSTGDGPTPLSALVETICGMASKA
jgi:3-oxoacyl-[acyl-carrier protein] reductase